MAKALKELSPEEKVTRDRLRSKTLGAPACIDRKLVEWNGETYELRSPSLKLQQRIDRLSTLKDGSKDNLKAIFLAVAGCVYIPETDILVFEDADEEAISERTTKDFIGKFVEAFADLSRVVTPEELEKNS